MIEYRSDPAFFIWGDGDAAVARWRGAADVAGVPVRGMSQVFSPEIALPVTNIPLAVAVDSDIPVGLQDRLHAEAEAGRRIALNAPTTALDAAAVWHANIRPSSGSDPILLAQDLAWLVDAPSARLEGTPVAVSSLCIASAVPAMTALRWIRTLTDRGLLVRVADPRDGRRVFIDLSDQTARTLADYLRSARRISPLVG